MDNNALLAKKVIVEIIRQSGGSLTGIVRLYKAFYAAHLYYATDYPGYLTEWRIVRMPLGPGIDEGDELLQELVETKILQKSNVPVGPHMATSYALTGEELPGEPLPEDAVKSIKKAVDWVREKNGAQLTDETHEYSRSWKAAENGEELNIYIDTIPQDEFATRQRNLRLLRHKIGILSQRI